MSGTAGPTSNFSSNYIQPADIYWTRRRRVHVIFRWPGEDRSGDHCIVAGGDDRPRRLSPNLWPAEDDSLGRATAAHCDQEHRAARDDSLAQWLSDGGDGADDVAVCR